MKPSPKVQALFQRAVRLHSQEQWAQAFSLYQDVVKVCPTHADAQAMLGGLLLQMGKPTDAVPPLRYAVKLAPRALNSKVWLALALSQSNAASEAEQILRECLKISPPNHELLGHLASTLVVQGRVGEAIEVCQQAVTVNPSYADGWASLGSFLHVAGRSRDAVEALSKALALSPAHAKARSSRAQALLSLQQPEQSLADFDEHLKHHPADLEARSFRLFVLHYFAETTADELAREHKHFGELAKAAVSHLARPIQPSPAEAEKKLKIGFLSPDLRQHSVAYFLEPLLRHLDRDQFEVSLYHDHPAVDQTSRRLQSLAGHWVNFAGLPHDEVERRIRHDAPDILIDLAGHTGFNRMPLYARRLAPVQITYLGYPDTTGLAEMDFRLTDERADPPGASDRMHTEKLVRFADTAWVYSPPEDSPEVMSPPVSRGHPFTFGSFNALSKVNDYTLRLWSSALQAVPGSRLLLKSYAIDETAFRRRAAAAGIASERLHLLSPTKTVAEHLACYHQVDVALDPFPYHGTTTTCEALWMGVPVLTLAGDRHSSRVGVSLLNAVGRPEWIADSAANFARIASVLTSAVDRLAETRAALRQDMRRSTLLDHVGQTGRFMSASRKCWREKCGIEAPVIASGFSAMSLLGLDSFDVEKPHR